MLRWFFTLAFNMAQKAAHYLIVTLLAVGSLKAALAQPSHLILVGSDSDGSIYLDKNSIDTEDGRNYPTFNTVVSYNRPIPVSGRSANSYLLYSFADCVEGFMFTSTMEAFSGRYANGAFIATFVVDKGQDRNQANDRLFRELCNK